MASTTSTTTVTTATTPTTPQVGATSTAGNAAQGKVKGVTGDVVIFAPSNTNYELHLAAPGYGGPLNVLTRGVVRAVARKAYTVPSGGNFISPIYGPPRTIQGRVRSVEGNVIVVQAGLPIHVTLPGDAAAVELGNGAIAVGSLVNVVALPGATFEPA
jgi:hypothetical protein